MNLELEPIESDSTEQNKKVELRMNEQSSFNQASTSNNEAEALYLQGMKYFKDQSDSTNARKAYDCFKKSAQMKHPASQCNLGLLYAEAHGVDYDPQKAVYWYKKSAQQGFDLGMVNLAKMLLKGEGIKENHQEAKEWILKAYEKGNDEAQDLLAYVAEEDSGKVGFKAGLIIFIVLLSIIPSVMMTYPLIASILSSLGMDSIKVIPAAVIGMIPSLILWQILNAIFLDE